MYVGWAIFRDLKDMKETLFKIFLFRCSGQKVKTLEEAYLVYFISKLHKKINGSGSQ